MAAQAAVTKATELARAAGHALTQARLAEKGAQERFDAGDTAITVTALSELRTVRESAERRHAKCQDEEQAARIALAHREQERAALEYDAHIATATGWRARMGATLQRFAALDAELARVVDDVADLIADAT